MRHASAFRPSNLSLLGTALENGTNVPPRCHTVDAMQPIEARPYAARAVTAIYVSALGACLFDEPSVGISYFGISERMNLAPLFHAAR